MATATPIPIAAEEDRPVDEEEEEELRPVVDVWLACDVVDAVALVIEEPVVVETDVVVTAEVDVVVSEAELLVVEADNPSVDCIWVS
ncbi:hypothetical protein N0V82_007601 [Gnomoniopsis sp. IMI 355080]|nr:hypothetical protein N0V82_007601 [Gnomoniopsis sp. IMI 355080]